MLSAASRDLSSAQKAGVSLPTPTMARAGDNDQDRNGGEGKFVNRRSVARAATRPSATAYA